MTFAVFLGLMDIVFPNYWGSTWNPKGSHERGGATMSKEEKKSWYETGYSGAEREQEKRDLGSQPSRFWLKPGASKEILFIDDTPFCYWEHSWRVGEDKQFYYATCVSKISPDGCYGDGAKGVGRAEYIGQYTIVDVTGYVRKKDNKEQKFELCFFSPKTKVLNKLKLKKEKKGSLAGQLYSVTRGDDHSPNTGDDFDFVREPKMEEVYKVVTYKGKVLSKLIAEVNANGPEAAKVRKYLSHHFVIPDTGPIPEKVPTFNYAALLAPMETAQMRSQMAGAHSFSGGGGSGSDAAGAGGATSDDVPF